MDWKTIQEVAGKTDLSRLQALSDEALDRELREAGIDPEAADRILLESLSKTTEGAAASKEVRLRVVDGGGGESPARVGRSKVVWAKVTGWVAATAAAAGLLARLLVGQPIPDGSQARPPDAATLRAEAARACDKQLWAECERKLNEARATDPDGENAPRVVEERKAIAAHMR